MSNFLMEMIQTNDNRTPEQNEAFYVHEQIKANCRSVCEGLVGLGRNLKEMRDRKLYMQLGYEDFTEYTEAEHGIKQRMAYNYISAYEKLGIQFLQSNAKLGITKVMEIATLDTEERAKLMAEHTAEELESMSTAEFKRMTEEIKSLKEQLSFLQDYKAQKESEAAQVEQRPFDEIEAEIRAEVERELADKHAADIAEIESQLAAAEAKKVDADELEKYRINAEKEAKAAAAEETKKLKAEMKELKQLNQNNLKAMHEMAEARKQDEEKIKAAEEQAKRAAELEAKISAAEAEKAAIEKKIKLSSDPELTRFKFLFEAWQTSFNAVIAQLSKLDEETQGKMKQALKAVMEGAGL